MSSSANPVSSERFAAALEDLPVSSLHAKAAEIQNSLNHLVSSNEQLKPFADEGDVDCVDAIKENIEVMERFKDRIAMLKAEVEGRGMPWADPEGNLDEYNETSTMNGTGIDSTSRANGHVDDTPGHTTESMQNQSRSGTLTDQELLARIQQRLEDDEEDGMHL